MMKLEQLYLTYILPYQREFKCCEIYNYELKKFDQELADSMNQKNIYTALDLPDFKNIKEVKLEARIIIHACKKLKMGDDINFIKENAYKILNIDGVNYQLIFFPSGTIPIVEIKLENLIFFMYQHKFQKIFFCGRLKISPLSKESINDFYKKNCFTNTKNFINFKNLSI